MVRFQYDSLLAGSNGAKITPIWDEDCREAACSLDICGRFTTAAKGQKSSAQAAVAALWRALVQRLV
jgi:hypothetical protein